jgi:hypothetical protein
MLEVRKPSLERHEDRHAANGDHRRQIVQRVEEVFQVLPNPDRHRMDICALNTGAVDVGCWRYR